MFLNIHLLAALTKFLRDQEMATPTTEEETTDLTATEIGMRMGEETGAIEEVAKMVAEMNKSYRKIKMLLKISSINNSCNFKPRTEVTLRYLNKHSKKNWIISSKNSWRNKKKREPKLMCQSRPQLSRPKRRRSQPKSKPKNDTILN